MVILTLPDEENGYGEIMVSGPWCTITHLYVSHSCRRQGIGSRLLNKAESHLKVCGCATATVVSTKEAVPFYKKNGYKNTWWNPTHLHKPLTPPADHPRKDVLVWAPWVPPTNVTPFDLW